MDQEQDRSGSAPLERRIFCNRTLNLRAIRAIGYDMDYTLVHYRIEEWERRAYERLRAACAALGWPVGELAFDPELATRGLVLDTERGNLLKANRFGYVIRASHGTAPLDFEVQRQTYSRLLVDLAEPRWVFLNTFFSLSEACMYAQLVDLLDAGRIPAPVSYERLYGTVRRLLDEAHLEGELKERIMAAPGDLVELDPELALTLLDQRAAGKRLLLITNSDWGYTRALMSYALDRYLPAGASWRDLFEVVVVSARKPEFFTRSMPLFEVVDEDGKLRAAPVGMRRPGVYLGGDARQMERYLAVLGEEILYVGDHLFADVHVSKNVLRWRTALIVRELEDELGAVAAFRDSEARLAALMADKQALEAEMCQTRLLLQRQKAGYGPPVDCSARRLRERLHHLQGRLQELDAQAAPLAIAAGEVHNRHWGPLMRAGNDKSHLARQVERFADIYTSRVSNFLHATPFVYLRAPRGSLPHD